MIENPLAKTGLMGASVFLMFIGANMVQSEPTSAGGYFLVGMSMLIMAFKYIVTNKVKNDMEE